MSMADRRGPAAVAYMRATTVVFLSDASSNGPQFRLTYQRKDLTMYGKFQMRMPGQEEWQSYLEWSGPRQ